MEERSWKARVAKRAGAAVQPPRRPSLSSWSRSDRAPIRRRRHSRETPPSCDVGPWRYEAGVFLDRSDRPGDMRPKNADAGYPLVGWKESELFEIGAAYEITKNVALDGSVGLADFDVGADLLDFDSPGFTSVRIARGRLQSLRLSTWFQVDGEHVFARDSTRRVRWMAGLTVGRLSAENVEIDRTGIDLLGVESVSSGSETTFGFGARADVRLGRSGWALGLESCLMWSSGGPLVEVRTSEGSPYTSAGFSFDPYTILVFTGYHF